MRSENGKFVDMIGTKKPYYQGWMPVDPPGPHEHRPIHTPVLKGTFKGSATIITVFRPLPPSASPCLTSPESRSGTAE